MRLLLDTHSFLWWVADEKELGPNARRAISDPGSIVFVSAASAWEIAIKRGKGTLEAPGDIRAWIAENAFVEMAIDVGHGIAAGALPVHHRDPFDRVLVAQALVEGVSLVTANVVLAKYGVATLPAGE